MNDEDEIKLNKQLYVLAKATKELIKDVSFNKVIIRLAKESNTETVYYSQIKEKSPDYYNVINQNLKEYGTSIEQITQNMTHEPILPNPKYPETGETEIYEPSIAVPNIKLVNENLTPLISPNEERVYDDETYILAWYFDKDGHQNQTLLGERTATNTSNPIFIFRGRYLISYIFLSLKSTNTLYYD